MSINYRNPQELCPILEGNWNSSESFFIKIQEYQQNITNIINTIYVKPRYLRKIIVDYLIDISDLLQYQKLLSRKNHKFHHNIKIYYNNQTTCVELRHKMFDSQYVDVQNLYLCIMSQTLPPITMFDGDKPPKLRIQNIRDFLQYMKSTICKQDRFLQ
jgi:hypothetical protein